MEISILRSLLRRVIAIPIVITAVLAGLLLWEAFELNNSLLWGDHTDQVLKQSENLFKSLVDMESGVRGYIVTGDASFLQAYEEGTKRFDSQFQALNGNMDDPRRQQRLLDIRSRYEDWRGRASNLIALRSAGKAASDLYESSQSGQGLDLLREKISEYQGAEEGLRARRMDAAHRRWTLIVVSCVGLGLGISIFFAFFVRYRIEALGARLIQGEERWSATLGSIGDGVIATDSQARVTYLNPVAIALTGWKLDEALAQPIGEVFKIVNEETGIGADDEVLSVLEYRHVLNVSNHVALVARDGREIAVEHSAAPILASKGKIIGAVLVFRDVAERQKEREAQKEQAALLELTQDSVLVIDLDGTIRFWSRGAEAMLGYSKSETAGRISHDLLHTEFPEPLEKIRAELMRAGHWEGDLIKTARDGKRLVVASRWALRKGKRGEQPRVLEINSDVTERRAGEESLRLQKEQLRALAERLQLEREEDRKRVARELHDQIGQILTAIKMDMKWITRHLPESAGAVLGRLTESIQLINDGVKSVRTICSGLRPGVLDDLGLAAAIEWQASEFALRNGIVCHVDVPPVDLHLDGDRATAAFRIFQECMTNVIRHAQAKSVNVSLTENDGSLLLVVADDGVGFLESDLPLFPRSLGVLGMKERAQFFGGDVHISSSPGNGTTVTVRVPVDIPDAEKEQECIS